MRIKIYTEAADDMSASQSIFDLLNDCGLQYEVETLIKKTGLAFTSGAEIYNVVGEKVKKLPHVVIDGERVGGYYDLVEYLMNKDIINYACEPKWKMNN